LKSFFCAVVGATRRKGGGAADLLDEEGVELNIREALAARFLVRRRRVLPLRERLRGGECKAVETEKENARVRSQTDSGHGKQGNACKRGGTDTKL